MPFHNPVSCPIYFSLQLLKKLARHPACHLIADLRKLYYKSEGKLTVENTLEFSLASLKQDVAPVKDHALGRQRLQGYLRMELAQSAQGNPQTVYLDAHAT